MLQAKTATAISKCFNVLQIIHKGFQNQKVFSCVQEGEGCLHIPSTNVRTK